MWSNSLQPLVASWQLALQVSRAVLGSPFHWTPRGGVGHKANHASSAMADEHGPWQLQPCCSSICARMCVICCYDRTTVHTDDACFTAPGTSRLKLLCCCAVLLQEREERRRRDEIRDERRRERERERRLEARDGHGPAKKSKLTRDRERDVGEKIALGMANVGATGEVQYDSRLFNQEQGMGTGFGAEDSYNLYDKPLFTTRESNLFKPVKNKDDELYAGLGGDGDVRTEKFKADRGFSGAEGTTAGGSKRGAGVEYETAAVEADPFGLEQFMQKVDRGRKPLDGIGQRGGMAAGGGGGGGYEGEGGSGRRMQFTSSGHR